MKFVFYISSIIAIISTLFVIIQNNPIYALIYLIISLISSSCICFSLGAYFAGAMEIIIYAGAIMVLFLFVIMIVNIGVKYKKQKKYILNKKKWIMPSILSILLLISIYNSLFSYEEQNITGELITIKNVGITLFGPYILAIELASMILIAAIIVSCHIGQNK